MEGKLKPINQLPNMTGWVQLSELHQDYHSFLAPVRGFFNRPPFLGCNVDGSGEATEVPSSTNQDCKRWMADRLPAALSLHHSRLQYYANAGR